MTKPKKPATPKVLEGANPKYKGLPTSHRYQKALELVVVDGWPIAAAAREVGVSRPRLSEKVPDYRANHQAKVDQSKALAFENAGIGLGPLGLQEKRRIGTFAEFDDRYFGNWRCPDCQKHHERPGFHEDIIAALDSGSPRVVVNMPPFHSKSTIVTVKHTIYDLVRDPNSRTIIISKSLPFAKTFLHSIGELLTNPDLYEGAPGNLVQDWGPFRGDASQWNQNQIYVAGRVTAEKDPTVQVLGYGGQIYGRRADRIKCDDIATLENQRNPQRVQEMIEWFDKEAVSRIGKRGQIAWVGTRVHAGDIYSVLGRRAGYNVLRYPCILDDATETVLWPDHFPYSHAMVLRNEMAPADWQLVYQNVDMPGLGASFTQESIDDCKNLERVLGHHEPRWKLIAGLDLAGGTKKSGYTAGVLVAVDMHTGNRFIVDLFNEKSFRAPQLKDKIFEWSSRYPIWEWRVENNGLQSQIVQYNEEIVRHLQTLGTRVVGHNTNNNKWDAEFGVESIAPLFNGRMYDIPWGNAPSCQEMQQLLEQLVSFPMGVRQDLTMALWFAELGIRDLLRRQHLPLFDERMSVPDRIRRRRRVIDFSQQEVRHIPVRDQHRPGALSRTASPLERLVTGRPTRHDLVPEIDIPDEEPKPVNL